MACLWLGDAASDCEEGREMEEEWNEALAAAPPQVAAAPPQVAAEHPKSAAADVHGAVIRDAAGGSASAAGQDEEQGKSLPWWKKAADAKAKAKAKAKASAKMVSNRVIGKQAPTESGPKPRSADKKKRAQRGEAQTFAGRRPPKDPALYEAFMAIREGYYQEVKKSNAQAKRTKSLGQELFLVKMRQMMQKDNSTDSPQAPKLQMCVSVN